MSTLQLTYDGDQHTTALKEPLHKSVAVDCGVTGKGEEFSPGNLLGISVASCMLLSMGALANGITWISAAPWWISPPA